MPHTFQQGIHSFTSCHIPFLTGLRHEPLGTAHRRWPQPSAVLSLALKCEKPHISLFPLTITPSLQALPLPRAVKKLSQSLFVAASPSPRLFLNLGASPFQKEQGKAWFSGQVTIIQYVLFRSVESYEGGRLLPSSRSMLAEPLYFGEFS